MMKQKATKLLAVVAMAASPAIVSAEPRTGANAAANTTTAPAVVFEDRPTNWNASVSFVDPLAIQSARPRQMPSGAPACGNVASRAPRRAECEGAAASPEPMLAHTDQNATTTPVVVRTTPTTARRAQTTTSIARRAQTATRSRVTGDKR